MRVTGVDVSADLVAAASARAAGLDNVRFAVADASTWQPEQAPDLYVSRHGVMFFPEPPAAFAHLSAIAAPGARIVFSCFRTARESLGERTLRCCRNPHIRVSPTPNFSRSPRRGRSPSPIPIMCTRLPGGGT
jgi:SAM-dependent methyltransferase